MNGHVQHRIVPLLKRTIPWLLATLVFSTITSPARSQEATSQNLQTSISTYGPGSGLLLNKGKSGEVFGGLRWPETEDKREFISIRTGDGGFRLTNNDNTKEIIAADNDNGIYFNGDIYINNVKTFDMAHGFVSRNANEVDRSMRMLWLMVLLSLVLNFVLFYKIRNK